MRHYQGEAGDFSFCGPGRHSLVSRGSPPRTWEAIFDLQKGGELNMPVSRPMPSVYTGVSALRIRDRSGIYRVFYYRQSSRGILVFHAFVKKTQTVPKLELARTRLKELLDEKI